MKLTPHIIRYACNELKIKLARDKSDKPKASGIKASELLRRIEVLEEKLTKEHTDRLNLHALVVTLSNKLARLLNELGEK